MAGSELLNTVMPRTESILFLGKENDAYCRRALEYLQVHFKDVKSHFGRWGDAFPVELGRWQGDYIISYLSRWIVPEATLRQAKLAALNFHPGSPNYPGFGCVNFALYEQSKEYGATCHYMAKGVDTGPVIAVKRFPILESDGVESLLARTYENQYALYLEIAGLLAEGKPLPVSQENWTRKAFTRKQFNELNTITPVMSAEEIRRRVRATSFGAFQPEVKISGYTFGYKPEAK